VSTHARRLLRAHDEAIALPRHAQLTTAWRNQHGALDDTIPVFRFFDRKRRQLVQTLSKLARELRGHVLHDDDARQVRG